MKAKKVSKRLELNKETIAMLNPEQLGQVQGGVEQRTYGHTTCTMCFVELTQCLVSSCCATTIN